MVNIRAVTIGPEITVALSRLFKPRNGVPWTLAAENAFAIALQESGRLPDAEQLYRDILNELDRQKSTLFDKQRSAVLLNLGSNLEAQQRFVESERCYRDSIRFQQNTKEADMALIITGLQNLASVLQMQGKAKEARTVLEGLLTQLRESLGKEHPVTLQTLHNLARLLHDQSLFYEAQILYQEVLESFERTVGNQHPSTLALKEDLAILNGDAKHYDAAIIGLQHVLAERVQLIGEENAETLRTQTSLGYFLQRAGKLQEAEACLRKALKMNIEHFGTKDDGTLTSMTNLAAVLNSLKNFNEAETLLRQVVNLREFIHGINHLETLLAKHNLAAFLIDQCLISTKDEMKLNEAEQLLQTILSTAKEILPSDHAYVANFESCYGKCLAAQNQMKNAEIYAVRGYVGLGRALGYNHERTNKALDILLDIYKQMGQTTFSFDNPHSR